MKYLVACNWDSSLIDKIDHPEVSSLFGGLPDSLISSGRPTAQIRQVPESTVRKFIDQVHEKKWAFDYNINSSCLANMELTRNGFKAIMKYLEWISDLGVDAVTITNTNLIGIVKKNFPKLKVNLSTFQKLTEVAQARRFEDLGVDLIMLSEHINRDFKTLRAIRKAVKCQLALIANVGCIYDCPNSQTHANSIAHSGAKGETTLFADPFMLSCFNKRLSSPEELVKIRWIRPEDVKHYEDIGIDVLKIIDRYMNTETLAERVSAYCQRSFDGNLITLLGQMADPKRSTAPTKEMYLQRILTRPGLKSLRAARNARGFSKLLSHSLYEILYLDNKSLPHNFIEGYAERDCRTSDCRSCGYCNKVASKAVRVLNEDVLAETKRSIGKTLEDIQTGTILY